MFDYIPQEPMSTFNTLIVHEQIISKPNEWDIPLYTIAQKQLKTMTPDELDADWRLNDFFGTIAVINMPQDTARLERITGELNGIGTYDFEIFPGIDGRTLDPAIWQKFKLNRLKHKNKDFNNFDRMHQGEAGCYMSHYLLIKQTKEAFDRALEELQLAKAAHDRLAISNATEKVRKYSRLLIFEDDNGFGIVNEKKTKSSKTNAGVLFRKALKELPKDWDILYLMCIALEKSEKTSKHIRRIKRSAFANAYVINHKFYEPLIAILQQIEDPTVSEVLPVDKAISHKHYLFHAYAIYPSIAFQYNGVSTIDETSSSSLTQFQP